MMDELINAEIAGEEIKKMFQDKSDMVKKLENRIEVQEEILDSVKAATLVLAKERDAYKKEVDKIKKELIRVEFEKLNTTRGKLSLEERVSELEMRIDVMAATEYLTKNILEEVE